MTDIPLPEGVDPDSVEGPCPIEVEAHIIDCESQQRLWLRVCREMMEVTRHNDEDDKVQRALDTMVIAAAARAKRILGGDVTGFER
jgi:hypothetical protein